MPSRRAPASGSGAGGRYDVSTVSGSVTVKVVPSPSRLTNEMLPPSSSTVFFAIARLRPLPE